MPHLESSRESELIGLFRNGKCLKHVRFVRRRGEKNIRREDDDDDSQNNVEGKTTIFLTSVNYDLVDKEECPKEILEVVVDFSSSKSLKLEFCNGSCELGT